MYKEKIKIINFGKSVNPSSPLNDVSEKRAENTKR